MEKIPFVNKEMILEIVKKYKTPFYIYDEQGIRENIRNLKKAFSWNKGFKEYFAVKATPNPYLMKIFQSEGCGVDCSSLTELMLAEKCGFHGDDIMFSSNVTPEEDFIKAKELDAIINFDDFTHIDFFKGITKFSETMCVRYNPGGEFCLNNKIMDSPKDAKYGMTKDQLKKAIAILKENGVKNIGIHSFLASNTTNNLYYPSLAKILFELAVEIKRELGIKISFINLSGGVGIPYKPTDNKNDIFIIGKGVEEAFNEVLVKNGLEDIKIFTELGRFMMGPYGELVSKVIHKKHIYKEYIGLDACAVNLMRPAMYGAYHHITVLGKENEKCDQMYDVTGGLCENNDKFAIDRMLPKIDIGDYIVIHDAGAHGFSMGYNYNGKLRSAELLLKPDKTVKLIRRAETPNDYFQTLDLDNLNEA